MTTTYEWDIETLKDPIRLDDGSPAWDIDDHFFCDSLEEAVQIVESGSFGKRCCVVLVKNVGDEDFGIQHREWFYITESGLQEGAPKKFQKELSSCNRLDRLKDCANFVSEEEYSKTMEPEE